MNMALEPFFSLTPLNPRTFTYDPSKPDEPYAIASMDCYGVMSLNHDPNRLADQYRNNELLLGYNPVDPADQTMDTEFYRQNVVRFVFVATKVSTDNQYLLLFSLRGVIGPPIIQFFAGASLVRSEELSGEEQVANLMDVPGDRVTTQVYLRLASSVCTIAFWMKGMDCYLL
jgi:hypothetical protein